ncbi:MAG: DUF5110 domain-containing protein [Anaerolineae bacterium]|nr:DUF5110 domain-containing protein [Anaerolineae bacterium]
MTSDSEIRALMQEFRQRRIPCDALYFDIDYMEGYRPFTWDPERFSDLPQLLQEMQRKGFRSVAILDPALKVDANYAAYQDGKAQGVFLSYPDGTPFEAAVWAGASRLPDFSAQPVRDWWAEKVAALLARAPFDGLWNDMNEPTVFAGHGPGNPPDYLMHAGDGNPLSHVAGGHNTYGLQMMRATRAGLERAYPQKRPYTLTRAGYAGVQRYGSTWTGDNLATWDHLRLAISMTMHSGLSGMPFTGPDLGGHGGAPDGEQFARWMQLGSMMPYFRNHTVKGTPAQEPWQFGPQIEAIARRYIELRYRLLPYFYSVMAMAHQTGAPFLRPAFFEDRSDPELRNQDDAFFIGDSLFVAPVLEPGATERTVYLPRGAWYDFWANRLIDGARHITVPAPLEAMPMFVRAGRVLPMFPVQQFVGEDAGRELTLRLYAGPGETTVYEDAGEGLGYQQGDYRFSYFTARFFPNGQYGVDWRTAGAFKPTYQSVRVEILGIPMEPGEITVDRNPAPLWFYENSVVEVVTPPFKELRITRRSYDSSLSAETVVRRPPR